MNLPRVAASAVVAWVLYLGVSYLVHTVLLRDLYLQHAAVLRPEAEANGILPVGFLFALVGFFAFAYAYAKGYEGGHGAQEGLRYGVLVGILICCFATIWNYMAFPIDRRLLLAWCLDYIVEFAIYGMVVGAIYRPVPAPARRATAV
jgi:hypothetical protein